MSAEAIDLRLTIGGAVYTLTAVGDPTDGMFAINVGRGVSEAIISHGQTAKADE